MIVFIDGLSSYMPTAISSRLNRTSPLPITNVVLLARCSCSRAPCIGHTDVFAVVRPNADKTYRCALCPCLPCNEAVEPDPTIPACPLLVGFSLFLAAWRSASASRSGPSGPRSSRHATGGTRASVTCCSPRVRCSQRSQNTASGAC